MRASFPDSHGLARSAARASHLAQKACLHVGACGVVLRQSPRYLCVAATVVPSRRNSALHNSPPHKKITCPPVRTSRNNRLLLCNCLHMQIQEEVGPRESTHPRLTPAVRAQTIDLTRGCHLVSGVNSTRFAGRFGPQSGASRFRWVLRCVRIRS